MARLRTTLAAEPSLVPRGGRILIALSGGGDSVALLHLLEDLRIERSLDLFAAHFDHGLRSGSSAEASRVQRMAARLNIPCTVERARGLTGGQNAYRRARYAFLEAEADRVQADRIALGHQLDDHVETVLLRLIRGTGLRGLRGIPKRRARFVRPLLGFTRGALRAELERRGVDWIEDESNRDARYSRARVRHAALPALREAGGAEFEGAITRLAADATLSDRALDARAGDLIRQCCRANVAGAAGAQIARSGVADYDRAVLARMLRKLAREQGFWLSRGGTRMGVEFIKRGRSGGSVDLAGGLRLSREYDGFRLDPPEPALRDCEVSIRSVDGGRGEAELGGCRYQVVWGTDPAAGVSTWTVELEASALGFPLRLRAPRPGDRIRGAAGSRKLKKLLNERRVPRSQRGRVPVLACADGRVLWVAGHSRSRDAAPGVTSTTFKVGVSEG